MTDKIVIKGLRQNNLKDISLEIPKNKIVVIEIASLRDAKQIEIRI